MMSLACSMAILASLWIPWSTYGSARVSPGEPSEVNARTNAQEEPSAEEIVARYLEAIGGADAVRAVTSKTVTYWVHMFGRDAYLMERSWTRPNGMRTGPPGAAAFTITEGDSSWRVSPEGRQELPAAVAANMSKLADIDGPLIDPAEKGVTLAYSGLMQYDMAELHHVTVTFAGGVEWEYFFDSRTGLLRKTTRPSFMILNGQISRGPDTHHYYYDYRPVGAVSYPHFWIQSTEDHTHLFVVDELQIRE